jgi:hypothetical protein
VNYVRKKGPLLLPRINGLLFCLPPFALVLAISPPNWATFNCQVHSLLTSLERNIFPTFLDQELVTSATALSVKSTQGKERAEVSLPRMPLQGPKRKKQTNCYMRRAPIINCIEAPKETQVNTFWHRRIKSCIHFHNTNLWICQ